VHWIFVHAGLESGNSPWYLFPSGWGAIIIPPLITAAPIVWVLTRKHNCHQPRCWRIEHLPAQGTPYVTCRRHHPTPPGKDTIRERYHLYAGRRVGRG